MRGAIVAVVVMAAAGLAALLAVGATARIRGFEATCYAEDGRVSFKSAGAVEYRVLGLRAYDFYGLAPEGFDRCTVVIQAAR